MGGRVTIYTRVYNTEKYLPQCLNSVIGQTYRNFQHLIFDNGCTDGCTKLLQDYAAQYPWVKLIRYEENQRSINCAKWVDTPYFTSLDSDDWWEPDYLERLVGFLEENDLDLAVTGTVQYLEEHGVSRIMRKLEQPALFTQKEFAQNYPIFWVYPSTVWATLQKSAIFKELDYTGIAGLAYGGDTMQMLRYIEQCSRIGIDNSALYHYRIHPKSVTYQYNPRRFDANIVYYEQIREFLELHHTFDPPKQEWLKRVHLASMCATLGLLRDARVTEEEKLAECARIVEHPLTALALTNDRNEREQWFSTMWEIVLAILPNEPLYDTKAMGVVLRTLAPHCYAVLRPDSVGLFTQEAGLYGVLQKDDWEQMVCRLMELIVQKRYTKQYNLGRMLCGLIPPQTPLEGISDTRFFREYADICMLSLCENYFDALDQMTGLLLEGKKLYAEEVFLKLYLSLAALEEQVPAFIFGKLQLGRLYLGQGRREECRTIVEELYEMGMEDEELTELRRELEADS